MTARRRSRPFVSSRSPVIRSLSLERATVFFNNIIVYCLYSGLFFSSRHSVEDLKRRVRGVGQSLYKLYYYRIRIARLFAGPSVFRPARPARSSVLELSRETKNERRHVHRQRERELRLPAVLRAHPAGRYVQQRQRTHRGRTVA